MCIRDRATAEPFEPEFTHQVFREDETIFGFRELRIDIFQSAHLFKTYVKVRFAEKVKSTLNPADDVIEALRAHFGEEMMTDEKAFLETLEADERARVPGGGGEIVAAAEARNDGAEKAVDVIRAFRLSDADVYPWHARFEPLILFYIDGASAVDSEDDNWTLLCATRHAYETDAERAAVVSGATGDETGDETRDPRDARPVVSWGATASDEDLLALRGDVEVLAARVETALA